MIATLKSFLPLFIATVFLTMGNGLMSSLLSINMRLQGYGDQVIGLVMSGNYLGILIGVYFGQRVVQKVGHIRGFAVFAAVITAVSLTHGLYMSAWLWGLLRILNGLCVTGLFMVLESWLNEKVEPVFRGRLLSIYMVLVYFGIGSGQFLLNVSDVQGQAIFMIAAILFALCLVPISITGAVKPQPLEVPRYNFVKLFQMAPLSMVAVFMGGLINSAFYALAPMVTLDMGLTVPQVSLFMSLTIWAGLLFQFPVGFFSDRMDRLTVLYSLGLLVCLVSVGMIVLGRLNLVMLYALTVSFGIVFSIYTVAMARAQDNIDKKEIVPVSAALILFFGVGACFGPITSSLVVSRLGPFGLYYFTAFCGGGLGLIVWSLRKRLPSSLADQVPTIPIPRTSPVVGAIDPRGIHLSADDDINAGASESGPDESGGLA